MTSSQETDRAYSNKKPKLPEPARAVIIWKSVCQLNASKISGCESLLFSTRQLQIQLEYLSIQSTIARQSVSLCNHLHDILCPMQTDIIVKQPVIQQWNGHVHVTLAEKHAIHITITVSV